MFDDENGCYQAQKYCGCGELERKATHVWKNILWGMTGSPYVQKVNNKLNHSSLTTALSHLHKTAWLYLVEIWHPIPYQYFTMSHICVT